MSSLMQLKLETLGELDGGKGALAFQHHMKRAAEDCLDRPADSKARTVTLKVELTPVMEDDGDCREVKAKITASSSIPVHKTKVYSLALRKNGILAFNPDAPDNINQGTLIDE